MTFNLVRALLTRTVPAPFRRRIALARRSFQDRGRRYRFACRGLGAEACRALVASYESPFVDYPGQESLAVAKRHNQALLAAALDGVVIRPGEVFSLWRLAGRPLASRGYLPAAAIRRGRLRVETGGATCLLATVAYNAALLGGLEILERRCHSVDSYGEDRYFELGRDAAIEYGYLDLRFRNPHPVPLVLRAASDQQTVSVSLWAEQPLPISVALFVSPPFEAPGGFGVRTRRVISHANGYTIDETLGESYYRLAAGIAAKMPHLRRRHR